MQVAILDDWEDAAVRYLPWQQLPPGVSITVFRDHAWNLDHTAQRLLPFQGVMAMRERTPFPRALLERLPNLRLLVTSGGGNPSIDLDAATERGIVVCAAPGKGSHAGVAELTFGLLLAAARQIPQRDRRMRHGHWDGGVGVGAKGRTLGLVGLGSIGGLVADMAKAFGMTVLAWSENLSEDRAAEMGARRVTKEELFRSSDFVSIHLRLSPRTTGLVDAHAFGLMKPTSYLINTSRAAIVDTPALVNALAARRIAGAALDVFDAEPLPVDHPLLRLDEVTVLSPHLGYVTDITYEGFFASYGDVLRAFADNDPVNVLNPQATSRS